MPYRNGSALGPSCAPSQLEQPLCERGGRYRGIVSQEHSPQQEIWSVPMAATVHPLTYLGLLFQVGLGSSSSMVPMASSLKGKLRGEGIGVVSRA